MANPNPNSPFPPCHFAPELILSYNSAISSLFFSYQKIFSSLSLKARGPRPYCDLGEGFLWGFFLPSSENSAFSRNPPWKEFFFLLGCPLRWCLLLEERKIVFFGKHWHIFFNFAFSSTSQNLPVSGSKVPDPWQSMHPLTDGNTSVGPGPDAVLAEGHL